MFRNIYNQTRVSSSLLNGFFSSVPGRGRHTGFNAHIGCLGNSQARMCFVHVVYIFYVCHDFMCFRSSFHFETENEIIYCFLTYHYIVTSLDYRFYSNARQSQRQIRHKRPVDRLQIHSQFIPRLVWTFKPSVATSSTFQSHPMINFKRRYRQLRESLDFHHKTFNILSSHNFIEVSASVMFLSFAFVARARGPSQGRDRVVLSIKSISVFIFSPSYEELIFPIDFNWTSSFLSFTYTR